MSCAMVSDRVLAIPFGSAVSSEAVTEPAIPTWVRSLPK